VLVDGRSFGYVKEDSRAWYLATGNIVELPPGSVLFWAWRDDGVVVGSYPALAAVHDGTGNLYAVLTPGGVELVGWTHSGSEHVLFVPAAQPDRGWLYGDEEWSEECEGDPRAAVVKMFEQAEARAAKFKAARAEGATT
jgi:hypothetical protein